MKDAIGGSALLYLVIFFVGIIIMLFLEILSYSKAYRVKNSIIESLESSVNILETYDINDDGLVGVEDAVLAAKVIAKILPNTYGLNSDDLVRISKMSIGENIDEYSVARDEIDINLAQMGYMISTPNCSEGNLNTSNYNYCLYKMTDKLNNGYYYKVVTYTNFRVPLIGDLLKIPVYGETKVLGKNFKEIDKKEN